MTFAPNADELLARNRSYAADRHAPLPQAEPTRRLAVVACMDARFDPLTVLGLDVGEAHILRNAGGVITDDVIRSLCLSQRFLGTREILLVHHTDCGLHNLDEAAFLQELDTELGVTPDWAVGAFADPGEDTRRSMQLLRATPFIWHKQHIRGFVYEVTDGTLREVQPPADP